MTKKAKRPLTKMEKLEALLPELNQALGVEGKVFLGRDLQTFERIPTGILALDTIMGGGLCRRIYHEFYGEEGSSKTTLALNCVAAVQRAGGIAAWVVGEEFDDDWAEAQGVDLKKLIKIEGTTGDLMLETARTLLENGVLDLLVFDSVQAIGTAREIDDGVDKEAYAGGGAPQLWGRMFRATRSIFNGRKSDAAIIGISQVRDAIGSFSPNGRPEPKPTQIRAIKHWKSISVYCKKGEPIFEDMKSEKRRVVSREFNLRCVKNKTAVPERVSSYVYRFRGTHKGIDKVEETMRLAKVYGLIEQRGKYLEGYGIKVVGSKEVPAADAYAEALRKKPSTLKEIQTDVLFESTKG